MEECCLLAFSCFPTICLQGSWNSELCGKRLTTLSQIFTTLNKEPFENIVKKEENAGNQHVQFFPQWLKSCKEQILPYESPFICHLQMFIIWTLFVKVYLLTKRQILGFSNLKSLQTTNQIWRKWHKVLQNGRNCSLRAISPFPHSVFKRPVWETCKNQGLFGKGLKGKVLHCT